MVNLGDIIPNFEIETTVGHTDLYQYFDKSWGMLFSYPIAFTPVCTTEMAKLVKLQPEFEKRNVKLIGLSCDGVDIQKSWCNDINVYGGCSGDQFPYPIICDEERTISLQLQILDSDIKDANGISVPSRAVYLVDPTKKIRMSLMYPGSTGRNFDEILRVIDSLQVHDKHKVVTPVDWKMGDEVLIPPTMREEEIKTRFPAHIECPLPSGKTYLKKVSL